MITPNGVPRLAISNNQIIIVIMDIERILKTRENAIYYGIGEYQKDCFGWVGGNAPACFDDKYLSDKDNLYFYLTFQNPLNPNKQISIFTPDFDIALEYNTYPDCKLLLVEHELSSQSKSDRYKHPEIDEIYSIYEMSTEKDMPEKNCVIKFGGNVMPIQWGLDNDGKVVKDGNSFIFQINEICMKDISVFMAGCIYVYGKIEGNKVTNPFVAYWEYS